MRQKLLEVLAEPGTQATLRLEAKSLDGDRVIDGRLISEKTGREYPIVRGIPRFVGADSYSESFGKQWNRYQDVQLDSATGGTHSRTRFDSETGFTTEEVRGQWVLDAGCGAGRFAEVAAVRGANLVALDMSSAVDAAAKTLASFSNVDVVQGSLLDPPLKRHSMAFAYCIGVAQHTPDPPRVVSQVLDTVRRGGRFAFSIYARRPWTKLNAKYLVRPLTRRLPEESLVGLVEAVMPIAFPVTDMLYRLPVLGRIAQFTIPVANYDRGDFTREQRYREAVLDTVDMLSPCYDSPMTAGEVDRILRRAGAAAWDFRTRVPINVVGRC